MGSRRKISDTKIKIGDLLSKYKYYILPFNLRCVWSGFSKNNFLNNQILLEEKKFYAKIFLATLSHRQGLSSISTAHFSSSFLLEEKKNNKKSFAIFATSDLIWSRGIFNIKDSIFFSFPSWFTPFGTMPGEFLLKDSIESQSLKT